MSKRFLLCTLIFLGAFFVWVNALAATATHIVISQIQTDGVAGTGGTEDDFLELYNPTGAAVDLTGWSIQKTSSTGGSLYRKELTGTIPAHGYFLIVRDHADTSASLKALADVKAAGSSFSLADNNTVYLVSNNVNVEAGGADPDIVDMVGMGTASNFEGTAAPNPADAASIERKPGSGQGNGEDTNNNSADFFAQSTAHPRNTSSATEQAGGEGGGGPSTGSGSSSGFFELEISEIFPNPKGKDAGFEWVEVYNSGGSLINISGWKIDDEGQEDIPSSNAYVLPEGITIAGKSYFVVQITKGKFALNNTGSDAVRVFDASGVLKLRQGYSGPVKEGYAYAKNSSNAWEWTENATPGSANIFAILTTYSSNLRISEVLPNPEGDDAEGEFIEIYNYGSDSVDLADWVVADERKRYLILEEDFSDTEIPAGGYFAIYREISGISLNNAGDEIIKLINPIGEAVDEIKFDASGKEDEAYAWEFGKVYRWTSFLTPGEKNIFVVTEAEAKGQAKNKNTKPKNKAQETSLPIQIPLSEIRSQELGTIITTSGIVVVEPGILGERVFYLQGSGIRVFLPEDLSISLRPGMKVQLAGELATFHNELQLKVDQTGSIQILSDSEPLLPHEIKTGSVSEEVEGFLVKIAGQITESAGNTFYIDDGSGETRILIGESTGIQKPKMKKGDEIQITGVVTQFDDIYRVMPRYQSDLVFGVVQGADTGGSLPRTGNNFWLIVAFLSGFCYSLVITKIIKLKRKETKNEQSRVI